MLIVAEWIIMMVDTNQKGINIYEQEASMKYSFCLNDDYNDDIIVIATHR